jgi:hypothetical protein
MMIGAQVAGKIEARNTTPESKAAALVVTAKAAEVARLKEEIVKAAAADKPVLEASLKTASEEMSAARKTELKSIAWKPLWAAPALFAGVIMLLFIALFRPPART